MSYVHIKRVSDLIVASVAIILLAPMLLITIILIKLDSPGPALFRQHRFGKDKVPFTVYKFRSMSVVAPKHIPTNDFHDAHAYITHIGKVIRKLSIDELPQLFNILQGHMSIVGPRPVVLSETNLIEERQKHGANTVKPGLTGWAQINGRDNLTFTKKAELDGWYAKNLSPMLDAKCVARTFRVVLMQEGNREGYEQNRQMTNLVEDSNEATS